jgi:plastocyanin
VRRLACGIAAAAAFGAVASPALADEVVHGTDQLVWDKPNVVIQPGQSVTWTFAGTTTVHHVAANGPSAADANWASFTSPLAAPAPDASYTFANEGTYNFYCSVHRDTMVGTVTVSAAPVAPPPPPPLSQQPFVNDTPADAPAETGVSVDETRPALSSLSVRRARRGAKVRFKVSEDAVTDVVFKRGKKRVKRYAVTGDGRRSLTAHGLKAGRYTVRLVAVDVAGNKSKARRRRVTVR